MLYRGKRMKRNKELWVGVVLVVLLGVLFVFVHSRSVQNTAEGKFTLYAHFDKSDGLMNGADVRLAGMRIGEVSGQELSNGYRVRTRFVFDKEIDIPIDSSVMIETDGLLGSKHIEILPGGDEELMQSGDVFAYQQDALILTELLEKVNGYMQEKKAKEAAEKEALLQVQTEQEVEQ